MAIDLNGAPDLLEGEDYIPEPANDPLAGAPDLLAGEDYTPEQAKQDEMGFWGRVGDAFTGNSRETEETRSLPEAQYMMKEGKPGFHLPDKDYWRDAKLSIGMLSALDDEDRMEVIKSTFPEAEFRTDEKGNTLIDYNGKSFVLNKPGMSQFDVSQGIYQLVQFMPAAKLATLGKGLASKVGLGFVGGAGTSLANDMVAEASGAEDAVSPTRALVAGGIESAFPLGGAAIRGIKGAIVGPGRRAVTESLEEVAKEGLEASKRTGIDLTKPQVTTNPYNLQEQKLVAQLPAGSQKAMKFLEKQNEQTYQAVSDFLDGIAPSTSVETGAARARTASQRAIDAAKDLRKQAENGQFQQAFKENPPVDVSEVIKSLDETIIRYPAGGSIAKDLTRFKQMLAAESKDGPGKFERLHNIKTQIYEDSARKGDAGLGPAARRELGLLYDDLRVALEGASDSYKAANTAWREASPDVDRVINSTLGKVADLDDTQLKSVSSKLFDAAETNPKVVKNARQAIEEVDPGAWNEVMRTELERRIGSIKPRMDAEVENVPGQLRAAIFGNAKQRRVLFAGMNEEQKKNAMWLDEALRRASLGRSKGSPTATNEEIKDRLGLVSAIRSMVKSPMNAAGSIGEKAVFDRRTAQLADMIFDPAYTIDMRQLRKYSNPESPGAVKAFTQMLTRMESNSAHGEKP